MMMHEQTLNSLLELCALTHNLILEENRVMRETGKPASKFLLKKKRDILPQIDSSLAALKKITAQSINREANFIQLVKNAQKKVMKILLLDRENEHLLLKCTFAETSTSQLRTGTAEQANQAYQAIEHKMQ